jgi:hypothetical protein
MPSCRKPFYGLGQLTLRVNRKSYAYNRHKPKNSPILDISPRLTPSSPSTEPRTIRGFIPLVAIVIIGNDDLGWDQLESINSFCLCQYIQYFESTLTILSHHRSIIPQERLYRHLLPSHSLALLVLTLYTLCYNSSPI